MTLPDLATWTQPASQGADAIFARHDVALTLGGEPTFLPNEPQGAEWTITAVGPEKLGYAYDMIAALQKRLPDTVPVFSPGKLYPGEVNPRWAILLVGNRSGEPLAPPPLPGRSRKPTSAILRQLREGFVEFLGLPNRWIVGRDLLNPGNRSWILPLDHDGENWCTDQWLTKNRASVKLLNADGPAGLRLPLAELPEAATRRALTMEWDGEHLYLFMPPLLQEPFTQLLEWWLQGLRDARIRGTRFQGYLPADDEKRWWRLGVAADPGVLEINLPPCASWEAYARWMQILEDCGQETGMRSWKVTANGDAQGTGGGNHLLFGGPSLEENPFFTRGPWLASILRYLQRHPVFAYLFSGIYVGTSSQAPRPDESGTSLWDLEMAYQHLASLGDQDARLLIGETLRHLHTDTSGNTHRCETSFDKFWSPNTPNGCLGLIEFRAIESLPHASWMAAVALLWRCVAAYTLEHEQPSDLRPLQHELHDRYFLPAELWRDLETVFEQLDANGMPLDRTIFRDIWNWRFPLLLETEIGGVMLRVRRACEGWPLLCETPVEGGSTSRFVDTSVDRLEISVDADSVPFRLFFGGRELKLLEFPQGRGAGLRYRRSALYPSLHPGIPVQLPLDLIVADSENDQVLGHYLFDGRTPFMEVTEADPWQEGAPIKGQGERFLTYDLRLP